MAIVEAGMDDLGIRGRMSTRRMRGKVSLGLASEFLLLVSCPTELCFSSRIVEVPSLAANWRAIASPTAPAPIT